jgi:hypothetical protein
MAQNKLIDYYNELPSWSKGVVAIGGLALVGIVGFTIYKKIKTNAELKAVLKESEYANDELTDLNNQGIKPTLTNSQISGLINSIIDAVGGCGTDEQKIYGVFKTLNNEADMQLLIKLFGVQSFEPCPATSPISYTKWLWDRNSIGGNFTQVLNSDLSSSNKSEINSILAKKGIKYRL